MELDLRQIKELMAAMGRTGLNKMSLKINDFELNLERQDHLGEVRESAPFNPPQDPDSLVKMEIERSRAKIKGDADFSVKNEERPKEEKSDHSAFITSPMVGTLYLSPSPEADPFIKVGDRVQKGAVVCIIEAMKVMNEVKANITGVVSEVLVENGHPIEFGTKIFRVTAAD